eukprot:scaffold43348_cov65-Phaeocystis_antarctica.AAC.2
MKANKRSLRCTKHTSKHATQTQCAENATARPITLVVPSRLQHRAHRSLAARPTTEKRLRTPASCLPQGARRPFAAPARTRAVRRPPQASTPVGGRHLEPWSALAGLGKPGTPLAPNL